MTTPVEVDTPPQANTFRFMVWQTVRGLSYLRAYWGRRLVGGAIGLMGDLMGEGASQAVYAHLPGHPQQAPDSLAQSGKDRDLISFRGESTATFATRVQAAWGDYPQGGTPQQVLKVVNQWGTAGWPDTWVNLTSSALVESGVSSVFTFTLTIPYGLIVPPWLPVTYGTPGIFYGQADLFYDVGPSTDIPMLLYLVRKWKPSRSRGFVTVFFQPTESVTFTV
jgi:hypothetical protein